MLKASELKIGNLIGHQDSDYANGDDEIHFIGTVSEIGERTVILSDPLTTGTRLACAELIPIPLTEEWLLKMGFEKVSDAWEPFSGEAKGQKWDYSGRCIFEIIKDEKTGRFFRLIAGGNSPDEYGWYDAEIPYVHSLQNLLFVIKGKELTIKQPV